MITTLREVTLGRERHDPEWAHYTRYSERNQVETEEVDQEQLGDPLEEVEEVEAEKETHSRYNLRRRDIESGEDIRQVRPRYN